MQDISVWIIGAIVVLALGLRVLHRFKPSYIAGGSPVKEGRKDAEGWTYAYGRQEKPELLDSVSGKRFKAWRWRELVHSPLKLEVQLKTVVPFASSTKEEVLTVVFERGKNDPWPIDPIECCIPNVTGSWGFSSTGKVDPNIPAVVQNIAAHFSDELALKEKVQERIEQDSAAEVDHTVSSIGRYLRPTPIPRREERQ